MPRKPVPPFSALTGRAYLYGFMAGGWQGVARAIALRRSEIESAGAVLGVSTEREIETRHVSQLTRLVPIADSAGVSPTG